MRVLNAKEMIKDIFKYGLTASITALFCCVAPSIIFALGLGSGIFAFQFADFFYNPDGSANVFAWMLRVVAALVVVHGISKYSRKQNCSLNTPSQRLTNKMLFAFFVVTLAAGLYLLFTHLTTIYFNDVIDVTRQLEYKK